MNALVISESRWKYIFQLFVSLGFVAAGVFILRNTNLTREKWIPWSSILFFCACAAVFIWQVFDPRARLKIDERGIEARSLGVGTIPWSEVSAADIKSIGGTDFVRLLVCDPGMPLGFQELNINLGGTNANAEQVHELILKLRTASRKIDQ